MSQDESNTTTTTVEPTVDRVSFIPIGAVLRECCRKQEEAIQAIEDSAYVVRRGCRELQFPNRLALAVRLRSKYMADFATLAERIREWERVSAYVRDLMAVLDAAIKPESLEFRQRLSRLILDLNKKYEAPKENRSE